MEILEFLDSQAVLARTQDFNFNAADRWATEGLRRLQQLDPRDSTYRRVELSLHQTKAVVLRDRNDATAFSHIKTGIRLARLLANPVAELELHNILVTAHTNRRNLSAARIALVNLRQSAKDVGLPTYRHESLLKSSNIVEHEGDPEGAFKLAAPLLHARDSVGWLAAVHTAQGRRKAKSARLASGSKKHRLLREAFKLFERSEELLDETFHPIWRASRLAAVGLALHWADDAPMAQQAHAEAQFLLRSIGIRNTWVEELGAEIGPSWKDKPDTLLSSWARALHLAKTSPKDAYVRLFEGVTAPMLRRALDADETCTIPIKSNAYELIQRIFASGYRSALASIVTEEELHQLRRWRNELHESSEDSSWNRRLQVQIAVLDRLEALLPPDIFHDRFQS